MWVVPANAFAHGSRLCGHADGARLTTVETVREWGPWLCTVADARGEDEEVALVPCEADGDDGVCGGEDGVRAWVNRCTHQAQRLYRGGALGAVVRGGEIVCPRHGSMFDACLGDCDNGEAAGTTPVAITVENGAIYLASEDRTFRHEGPATAGGDGDDEGPGSTSHVGF